MTTQLFALEQIALLEAAFPSFRMTEPTKRLYLHKLTDLEEYDLQRSVDFFLTRGAKFPTIGQIVTKGKELQHERTKRAAEYTYRLGPGETISSDGVRREIWHKHFEIGRQRANDGFDDHQVRHREWLTSEQALEAIGR